MDRGKVIAAVDAYYQNDEVIRGFGAVLVHLQTTHADAVKGVDTRTLASMTGPCSRLLFLLLYGLPSFALAFFLVSPFFFDFDFGLCPPPTGNCL
jgi:hypothetical protein